MSHNYIQISELGSNKTVQRLESQEVARIRATNANERELSFFVVGLLWLISVSIASYFIATHEVGSSVFNAGLIAAGTTTFVCSMFLIFCKYYADRKMGRISESLDEFRKGWISREDVKSWVEESDSISSCPSKEAKNSEPLKEWGWAYALLEQCEKLNSVEEIRQKIEKLKDDKRLDFSEFVKKEYSRYSINIHQKRVLFVINPPQSFESCKAWIYDLQKWSDENRGMLKELIAKTINNADEDCCIFLSSHPETIAEFILEYANSFSLIEKVFPHFDEMQRDIFCRKFASDAPKIYELLKLIPHDLSPQHSVFEALTEKVLNDLKIALKLKEEQFNAETFIAKIETFVFVLNDSQQLLLFDKLSSFTLDLLIPKIDKKYKFSSALYGILDLLPLKNKIAFFNKLSSKNELVRIFQILLLEIPCHGPPFSSSFFEPMKVFPKEYVTSFGLAWKHLIESDQPPLPTFRHSNKHFYLYVAHLLTKEKDQELLAECLAETATVNAQNEKIPSFQQVVQAKLKAEQEEIEKRSKAGASPSNDAPPPPPKAKPAKQRRLSADELLDARNANANPLEAINET